MSNMSMASEAAKLNKWHQDSIRVEKDLKGHPGAGYLRHELKVQAPKKGGCLPIRGRCDLIDEWVRDEYRDEMPSMPEPRQPIWETVIW